MNHEFKVGDEVKVVSTDCAGGHLGKTVIRSLNYSTCFRHGFPTHLMENGYYQCESDLELIKSTKIEKNIMTKLTEKFALLLKSEPEKSFRKSDITGTDDILTEEGTDIFLSWLLKKNGEAFKTEVVDELLKKDKECKE